MEKFKRRQSIITLSLFVIYLVSITWIILFKMAFSVNELTHLRNVNLIPFADSTIINNRIDFDEIIQNLIIFIPFGIYLSMLKPNWTWIKRIVPIASVS